MKSNQVAVRLLIAYLKNYGISRLVLSPGTRNIPLIMAVEQDPFFKTYSVVDERNAAFFAIGLAQQVNQPVGICCTSGTAASNYLTGITEAFLGHIPIAAITCDRNLNVLNQLETQKIDQQSIFRGAVRKTVELPVIKDVDDVWFFGRLLSEVFIEMRRGEGGPVHINLPLCGDTNALWENKNEEEFPLSKLCKFVDLITPDDNLSWKKFAEKLQNKRVMIVAGGMYAPPVGLSEKLARFAKKTNAVILGDHFCNLHNKEILPSEAVIKGLSVTSFAAVKPDVVITFGTNFQERIKDLFKANRYGVEHWSIDRDGVIRDVFKCQTAVFECSAESFFDRMFGLVMESGSRSYRHTWEALINSAKLPDLPFGQFKIIQEFAKALPGDSILHLSILNAVRLMQFFEIDPTVRVTGNINAFGIDGAVPTFMGQAAATNKLAFLVVGDLSFFYAMNAISIKHRKANIRILLINNCGAAEFHIPPTSHVLPTVDQHIGCAHKRKAEDWAKSCGYEYLAATDENNFNAQLSSFVCSDSSGPKLMEVFTDCGKDGEICLSVYRYLESKVGPVIATAQEWLK